MTSPTSGRTILEHETRIDLAFPQQTPLAAILVLVATILDLGGDVGFVIPHVFLGFANVPFDLFLQGTHGHLGHVVPVVLDKGGARVAATRAILEHERLVVGAFPLFGPNLAVAVLVLASIFVGRSRVALDLAAVGFVAHTIDCRQQEPQQQQGEQKQASKRFHLASIQLH